MSKKLKNKDRIYFKRVLRSKDRIIKILQEQVTLIRSKLLDETIEDFGEYRKNTRKYNRLEGEIIKIKKQLKAKDAGLRIYY